MLSEVLEKHLRELQTKETVIVQAPAPVTVNKIPPSDKQISFFKDLVVKKQLTEIQRTSLLETLQFADKRGMTDAISFLISLPWVPRITTIPTQPVVVTPPTPKVAQGYYAIVDPTDQILKFYQVRCPKQGKWTGYVFLSQVSGGNHIQIRNNTDRVRIMTEITKDAVGALKRFGQEIGQCGHCRKQLTDAVSREFGIGPVCRKVLGV